MAQTVHSADDDLAAAFQVSERKMVGVVEFGSESRWIFGLTAHVSANSEYVVGSGQAENVEFWITVRQDGRSLYAAVHVLGHGVALGDPIDPDPQHVIGVGRDETGRAEVDLGAVVEGSGDHRGDGTPARDPGRSPW